jgi:hypothetical protein
MRTPSTPTNSGHRRSVAVYRAILRLYPRRFREPWAEEVVLLFAELARRRPPGAASTIALWTGHLPDLAGGLFAEWWRELGRVFRSRPPAVIHGALAGALLSTATIAGNLGRLWATPLGHVGSWLICAASLTVTALTGRSTGAGPGQVKRALRNGFLSGLIAFTSANLTATVIVVACFDRLRHDPVQITAFIASHESDFRSYQLHELLGGWVYGSAAGALLGTVGSGLARMVRS